MLEALALALILTGCYNSSPSALIEDMHNNRVVSATSTPVHTHKATKTTPQRNDVSPEEIWAEINAVRDEHGLPPLSYISELEPGAYTRAKEVSAEFSHYRPDGSPCTTVSELADGEIIARVGWHNDAKYIVNGWMNSKPHREAILRSDCEMEMAAGCYYNSSNKTVAWSVLFHLV